MNKFIKGKAWDKEKSKKTTIFPVPTMWKLEDKRIRKVIMKGRKMGII